MHKSFISIGAFAFTLGSCTSEPITIPDDLREAAQFCIAAKGLSLRDDNGRQRGDPITVSISAKMQAYAMIAASKIENFEADFDKKPLVDADKVSEYGEQIRSLDYEAIAMDCDRHFGIIGELSFPSLPEDDIEALYSCRASSEYMEALLSGERVDDEGKREHYNELNHRLEKKLETVIARHEGPVSGLDKNGGNRLLKGMRHAYSQGNMINFLAACNARFADR